MDTKKIVAKVKTKLLGRDKIIERLEFLSSQLKKFSHRWGESPSSKLKGWVSEYDDIKDKYPEAWKMYCEKYGAVINHDAFDVMS